MKKPDSQQRGLAGEYYVAFILSRLGYDVGITIGRAKKIDIVAIAPSGRVLKVQVKSTYHGSDWLVSRKHGFDPGSDSVVAFVRLGHDATQRPELYLVSGKEANSLTSDPYKTHSPRISRASVQARCQDHDLRRFEKPLARTGAES